MCERPACPGYYLTCCCLLVELPDQIHDLRVSSLSVTGKDLPKFPMAEVSFNEAFLKVKPKKGSINAHSNQSQNVIFLKIFLQLALCGTSISASLCKKVTGMHILGITNLLTFSTSFDRFLTSVNLTWRPSHTAPHFAEVVQRVFANFWSK